MIASLVLAVLVAQPTAFRLEAASSEAGFDLQATLHVVHGETRALRGSIRAEPAEDGSLALSGRIEIDAASLVTGNPRRDRTMRETSLRVDAYPTIAFAPERFVPSGPPGEGGATKGILAGTVTIRGTSRHEEFPATLRSLGDRIEAAGAFEVPWAEYGIPDPSFLFVRIARTATARFRADFVPEPSSTP